MGLLVQINPILSSAVFRIRSAVSSLELVNEDTGQGSAAKKEQEYWLNSFSLPWRGGTRAMFLSNLTWQLIATGECLLRVEPLTSQAVFEILDTEWEINYEKDTKIPLYVEHGTRGKLEIRVWDGRKPKDPFCIRIGISDLAYDLPHSPLRSVLAAKGVFDTIYEQALAILQNRPTLSGVLSTDAKLSEDQLKDLTQTLRRYRTGGLKAGGVLALSNSNKTEFKHFNSGLENVLTTTTRQDSASDIAIGLGVPLELIGLGRATFSNLSVARQLFYESTVLPLYGDPLTDALSAAVLPPYAPLVVNRDKIDAFREARIKAMTAMSQVSFLPDEDKQAFFGYSPRKVIKP